MYSEIILILQLLYKDDNITYKNQYQRKSNSFMSLGFFTEFES